MTDGEQIVRQPGDEQVPIVIEAEKPQADPDQVSRSGHVETRPDGLRATGFRPLASGAAQLSRSSPQPRNDPEQGRKAYQAKGHLPSVMTQKPGHEQSFEHQPGAGAEIENAAGQPAFRGRKKHANDLRAAWQVNRFTHTQEQAEPDERTERGRKSRQTLCERPQNESTCIKPTQV